MQSLYESFSQEMMATSQRITNSRVDSEDILQEAFMTSFRKIGQLKDELGYGGWLKRIVINSSLRQVKSRRNYTDLQTLELEESAEQEGRWYEGISFDLIRQAIQELPDGCREIFSLYLLEGYKHREIAEALEVAVSTSKSQYSYALKLIRTKLKACIHE